MTDLQIVDKYIEGRGPFINPTAFNAIRNRGLVSIIDRLPNDNEEAKAIARARLSKTGKYTGDVEIESIAFIVYRLEDLRDTLAKTSMTEVETVLNIIAEIKEKTEELKNYLKQ